MRLYIPSGRSPVLRSIRDVISPFAASAVGLAAQLPPNWTGPRSHNRISIEFDHTKSEKYRARGGETIALVQVDLQYADGKPYMPGELVERWKPMDAWAVAPGWTVDVDGTGC